MKIRNIRKGFEAIKCKFKEDSKHLNANWSFEAIERKFEPFERVSKRLNANSNHSKRIEWIRMQI